MAIETSGLELLKFGLVITAGEGEGGNQYPSQELKCNVCGRGS